MTGRALTTRRGGHSAGEVIETPSLEWFNRHRGDLATFEVETVDRHGRPCRGWYPLPDVTRYTRLIRETDCHAIVAELEAALVPAHFDQARALAETIIGRYTSRELVNPAVFAREVALVFGQAPADLGQRAADELRAARFMPNPGDLLAVLQPLIDERRRALRQARAHLAEHQRRKAEAAKPKPEGYRDLSPTERAAFDAEIARVRRGGAPRPLGEVLGRAPGVAGPSTDGKS